MARTTSPGKGPLFPMQVVQPYPTTLKPNVANGSNSPLDFR